MIRPIILFLSFFYVAAKHEEYDGHTLFEVKVFDEAHAELLEKFGEHQLEIDYWSHAHPTSPGQVLVSKQIKIAFQEFLISNKFDFEIKVENIKEKLDLEDQLLAEAAKRNNRTGPGLSFDQIHRYEVVDAYLQQLGELYPETVKVLSAGRSIEGRDVKYLKISTTNFEDSSKPIVMMQSLLHCREWVTLPATLYAIHKLVIDITERDVLENIDWIIVPIVNPDGYEFTHTSNRFWRKNRAVGYFPGNICTGVDLNRNFDIFWATASSTLVCSDTFHGSAPFSEPETQNIQKIMLEHKDRIELYMDIHSFGSWILYGYGNGEFPPNVLDIHLAGVTMAQAIDAVKLPTNINYVVGNTYYILYAASGTSQDFAQSIGIPLSYTYELPAYRNSNSITGFLVDPSFIEQAGYETWEGIKAGARFALNNYRKRRTNE